MRSHVPLARRCANVGGIVFPISVQLNLTCGTYLWLTSVSHGWKSCRLYLYLSHVTPLFVYQDLISREIYKTSLFLSKWRCQALGYTVPKLLLHRGYCRCVHMVAPLRKPEWPTMLSVKCSSVFITIIITTIIGIADSPVLLPVQDVLTDSKIYCWSSVDLRTETE